MQKACCNVLYSTGTLHCVAWEKVRTIRRQGVELRTFVCQT